MNSFEKICIDIVLGALTIMVVMAVIAMLSMAADSLKRWLQDKVFWWRMHHGRKG